MSDPTIQTFCCHHGNNSDIALTILKDFNSFSYNIICLFSSGLGILGAIYQILPRTQYTNNHRWLSFSAERGRRIIVWFAIADLFAVIGVFIRSSIWLRDKTILPELEDDWSVTFCAIFSALTQYFYTSSWIWTLCYAIDMRYVLKQREEQFLKYHLFAWILPAILTTVGLFLLYYPDAKCHTFQAHSTTFIRIFPNYVITYLPILVVMIINPILYKNSIIDLKNIITCTSGQFTSREREILEAIKIKFTVINAIFYLCWIPNLISGFILWTLWFNLPSDYIILCWYIMAVLNPLQAFFNALVYRRWSQGSERVIWPWRHYYEYVYEHVRYISSSSSSSSTNSSNSREIMREEIYPLLQKPPPPPPSNKLNS